MTTDRNGHPLAPGDLVAIVGPRPPFKRGTVKSVDPDRVVVRTETRLGYTLHALSGAEVVVVRKH
jgi:hypothetical protein